MGLSEENAEKSSWSTNNFSWLRGFFSYICIQGSGMSAEPIPGCLLRLTFHKTYRLT